MLLLCHSKNVLYTVLTHIDILRYLQVSTYNNKVLISNALTWSYCTYVPAHCLTCILCTYLTKLVNKAIMKFM